MDSQDSNKNIFVHTGKVSGILGDSVIVSLDQNIHCESCRAKAGCGISDSNTKEIEVMNPGESFVINEHVQVVIKKALGLKAVFWAYVFPFILVISVLIISSIFLAEWQAGLLALLILVPYYFILHYLNSFLKKEFKVSVLKLA